MSSAQARGIVKNPSALPQTVEAIYVDHGVRLWTALQRSRARKKPHGLIELRCAEIRMFRLGRGGHFANLNYDTALAVMNHHGKGLLGTEEFFAAAFGVTERTSRRSDPRVTGLDAPRTSKFGVMQATGNMWTWGHDGDPDEPQASLFGGAWSFGAICGSRASNWYVTPSLSYDGIGARGRCDHLQPEYPSR